MRSPPLNCIYSSKSGFFSRPYLSRLIVKSPAPEVTRAGRILNAKTIRQQAAEWGNPIVGGLHREEDDCLELLNGKKIILRVYFDDGGAEYDVDAKTNKLTTITTADGEVI